MSQALQEPQRRLDGVEAVLGIPGLSETLYEAVNALNGHPSIRDFTVDGKPIPWKRPEFNRKTKRRYTDSAVRRQMADVGMEFAAARLLPLGKVPVGMLAFFVFEHPPSHYTAAGALKAEHVGTVPGHNLGDTDNLMKLVKDGLNGVAYDDDTQIAESCEVKRWAQDGERAHSRVMLWPL